MAKIWAESLVSSCHFQTGKVIVQWSLRSNVICGDPISSNTMVSIAFTTTIVFTTTTAFNTTTLYQAILVLGIKRDVSSVNYSCICFQN